MKTKTLPICIVLILVITSINVIANNSNKENTMNTIMQEDQLIFSQASYTTNGEYLSINVNEANTFLTEPGKPMLPVYSKTYIFPLGTKIKNVELTPIEINTEILQNKIEPAPQSRSKIVLEKTIENKGEQIIENNNVYSSSEIFPDKWYNYNIGCGINNDEHVIYLTIHCYITRYSPAENTIYKLENADIKIVYEQTVNLQPSADEYDLVIIAPNKFSNALEPLIEHKNSNDMRTVLKTTEKIYDEYNGRDKPEQIKYFIKDAIETWGIKYVLLVGGRQGQLLRWYVPVRYSNYDDYTEATYLTDLYYSDIYKYNESSGLNDIFEDWDSNGNDIFAEWDDELFEERDIIDYYPDVYVGRLPCRNRNEVRTVVDKIITYEDNTYGEAWFKKIMAMGGDTYDDSYNQFYWYTDVYSYPDERYTIYAQCHDGGLSSSIESVAVNLLNRGIKRVISQQDETNTNNLDTVSSDDPVVEIIYPFNGEYVWDEVEIVVKAYDLTPPFHPLTVDVWIKNSSGEIVKTFTTIENDYFRYDGEIAAQNALDDMPDDFVKNILLASDGTLYSTADVVRSFNDGYGFIYMEGHGNPSIWSTHPPNDEYGWVADLRTYHIPLLNNGDQLPVVVVGSCHNSQFDVSILNFFKGIKENGLIRYWLTEFGHAGWVPKCWSWRLVRDRSGGAIAVVGSTALASEIWIEPRFFHAYGNQSKHILGEAHSQTIIDFINIIGEVNSQGINRKTIEEWALLGDPSLMIGGYQS